MRQCISKVVLALFATAGALSALAQGTPAPQTPVLRPETHRTPLEERKIIQLQPNVEISRAQGEEGLALGWASLNPAANAWFILEVGFGNRPKASYHLENPWPDTQSVALAPGDVPHLVFRDQDGTFHCEPWSGAPSSLENAQKRDLPFVPICEQRLLLRNAVTGRQSLLELATDTLRKHGEMGEPVISAVKKLRASLHLSRAAKRLDGSAVGYVEMGPPQALLNAHPVMGTQIGIPFSGGQSRRLKMGMWYPVDAEDGVFISATQPGLVAQDALGGDTHANLLDPVEASADAYLVAFDLARFDIGYEPGTKHPSLGWSSRPPTKRARSTPGPDGFADSKPLIPTGVVRPDELPRAVAVFAGGFKREHSAFREGSMAHTSDGHHYGMISHGTILSRLNPGLSTLLVRLDGHVSMKEWTVEDGETLLPNIRFARQNGVPLVQRNPVTGHIHPGALVGEPVLGNWMGDSNATLRTLRAGACLIETAEARYLVYAVFTQATPSAMARVFQAYGCVHAMLLDMNAVVHTYMAVFERTPEGILPRHLISEMGAFDVEESGSMLPRFLSAPDNRDFFYVLRKKADE